MSDKKVRVLRADMRQFEDIYNKYVVLEWQIIPGAHGIGVDVMVVYEYDPEGDPYGMDKLDSKPRVWRPGGEED